MEIPTDYTAEKNVITTLAMIPDYFQDVVHLTADHFFDELARDAFAEMSLRKATGRGWMAETDVFPPSWLTLGEMGLSHFQFIEAVRRIEDAHVHRAAYVQALEIIKATKAGDTKTVEQLTSDFSLPQRNSIGRPVNEIVADLYDRIGHYDEEIVKTYFSNFDKIGILRKREAMGLAGRPSMGKSQLAFQWGGNITLNGGVVLVASLEMAEQEMVARIVGSMSGQSLRDAKSENEVASVSGAMSRLMGNKNLIVIDQDMTTHDLWGVAHRVRAEFGYIDLIIADHIRLFTDRADQERHRLGSIVHNLRRIAKDMNCSVVPLIQLSRASEHRKDRRPGLGDLRDSGEIEENLDVASFIYRDAYYQKDENQSGEAEIYAQKNRNGALWFTKVWFDALHGPRFAPITKAEF